MYIYMYIYVCICTYMHIYICVCLCLHCSFFCSPACLKSLGLLLPTWLRSLLGHCGAHGRLAGLLVAVPGSIHSASSIVANGFLGVRVLEAAVLAGGVLAGLTCRGSVSVSFFPVHLVLFHVMTNFACPRTLGLALLGLAVPTGPLARECGAFIIQQLFAWRVHYFWALLPAGRAGWILAVLAPS